MLSAKIKKVFPGGFTLDVAFEAADGVTVLFGASGSGKTLTLDSIAGFVRPDEGRILLDDAILYDGAAGVQIPPQTRHCGYVFQNYALFPHMTLRENLEFAVRARKNLDRHKRVTEMLERFQIAEVASRLPHALSGGQKQRGSIARALLAEPRLVLLDEPAQGLDAMLRQELYSVLREVVRDFRTPILLVTHDLEEAMEVGHAMHVYREGRIVQSGTPTGVAGMPASAAIARQLGIYNLLEAEILALDPGRNTSRLRVGEFEVAGSYYPGHLIGDRVLLCVHPAAVSVHARNGSLRANQMALELEHVAEGPHRARLWFAGGIRAEITRVEWSSIEKAGEFAVEMAPHAVRLIKG